MKQNLLFILILLTLLACKNSSEKFVCKPCDLSCDELSFTEPGICPHCNMGLINKNEILPEKELVLNEIKIKTGSGKFLIDGGLSDGKQIVIHYYQPSNLNPDSPVIIVLPGAGRNGDDYRDAWIEKAEIYDIMVVSPEYSEEYYPEFWNYNLAGMIKDVEINKERTAMTGFILNENPDEWIYKDFDRIFEVTRKQLNLNTDSYDLFGHSAGGQILHRLAIFNSDNKANRIISSNSGWYTLPTENEDFPIGLKDSYTSEKEIDFSKKLVLFLGEKDDADETRGDLRRSPEIDKQGLHRLERAIYFYNESRKIASDLNVEFNWKLKIIPDVGHDYRAMSNAAADYLYGVKI
jgi:pimeloyl-ACP methyl ester carboxylesterase